MTARTAVAGGGNWTAAATWSPSGTPLAGDDLTLDNTSGNVVIDSGAVGRSLDCSGGTGYTGTLTHTAGVSLALGDATAGAGNVALKFVAGMTYTPPAAAGITLNSTSATQQTITTASKVLGGLFPNGVGGSWILADALNVSGGTLLLNAGTFNTGNFAVTASQLTLATASAKTFTPGSSAIAITANNIAAVNVTGSGITITANTAVITFSGASAGIAGAQNWNGASLVFSATVTVQGVITNSSTFNNVTVTGPANKVGALVIANNPTITGTLTVNGNSTVNRVIVRSDAAGITRTVTVTTGFSFTSVDIQDITAAGAAGTWTGTSMGNALGNSNITFDPAATQTRSGAGGNYSTAGSWTSRVPLPQDNVVIGAGASGTITADMPRLGADIDFTGFTGTAAFNSVANTLYGSLNLASGMTISGTQTLTLAARSAKTITSNGKTFTQGVSVIAPGGSYTLQDAGSFAGTFLLTRGLLDTNVKAVTAGGMTATGGTAADVLTITNSTVTLTGTSGLLWNFATSAMVLNAAGSTIVYSVATASALSFGGNGKTYGTLTYTVAGSTGSLTITGANTFGTLNFSDASNARSLLFTAATTTTITTLFNVVGTAGKLMTIDSATAATHTLSKASGIVSVDFVSIKNSLAGGGATWYAGANSTDAGGNTGWQFVIPPTVGFSGTGTLSFAGTPSFADTLTLSGSGTMTLAGVPAIASTLSLSGAGTMTLAGTPTPGGTLILSGSGQLTLAGTPKPTGLLVLSGSGTLAFMRTGDITINLGVLHGRSGVIVAPVTNVRTP